MAEEMDASPSYFSPDDLGSREQYRRYGKRQSPSNISPLLASSVSKFSEARLLYDGNNIQKRPNAALLLEEIKQEVESFEPDGSIRQSASQSLKLIKQEDDFLPDGGETIFTLFASLLDSALQGLMPFPDLILHFEKTCRNISESIRYGSTVRHRVVEDKFIKQKARLLLDEAASWSLLWYLFGKGNYFEPT
uniref:Uncharacterized protein n=1 Tax=Ananas comosus var. bracteatus TaxID=296719 RepID=A0A6V7NF68_ANACO|nr:unnamed protein product [Ananas comosus var. bracteatus]